MNVFGKHNNKIKPKIKKYINNCHFDIPDPQKQNDKNIDNPSYNNNELNNFMNSQKVSIFMGILTIYTIFASDIDRAFFTAQASLYFSIVHSIAIGIFFAEIVIMMLSRDNYIGKFYFWIDIMSTLTMFLQLIWIEELLSSSSDVSVALSFAKVTKASRLSKIGAKSFKIMKLVRLIRLMKFFQKTDDQLLNKNKNNLNDNIMNLDQRNLQGNQNNQSNNDSLNNNVIKGNEIDDQWNNQPIIPKAMDVSLSSSSSQRQKKKKKSLKIITSNKRSLDQSQSNRGKRQVVFTILEDAKSRKQQQIQEQPGILGGIKNCVILPPIERKNVNPQQKRKVQQKWQEMIQNSNEKNKNKKKDNLNAEQSTKVGQILKQEIQKNIVLMIVGLIIFIPIFAADTWFDQDLDIPTLSIQIFNQIHTQEKHVQQILIRELIQVGLDSNLPLVYLNFSINSTCCVYPQDFPQYHIIQDINSLRSSQVQINENNLGKITLSKRELVRLGAKLNIIRGFFITLLLVFSSLLFMKNIEQYALNPLQKMTKTITKISQNPFQALKQIQQNQEDRVDQDQKKQEEQLQTNILSGIMVKMINLVVIGAGQIGSSLIINSINQATFDPNKVETNHIVGVFMYVRIANLQRISEVLDDNIIIYINSIAQIVHEKAVKYGGIPCQTDSQGFLIMWPFKKQSFSENQSSIISSDQQQQKWLLKKNLQIRQITSLSIISFVQSSIALAKSKKLRRFQHILLPQINNYQNVKIHCGLHIGQTLEGAIGSNFKLETKCLGQDTLITKSLSFLCQQYGITNIISQELYNLLSSSTREWTRKIDNIPHFQSGKVLQIFTIDLYLKGIDQQDYPQIDFSNMRKYVQASMKKRQNSLNLLQTEDLAQLLAQTPDFIYARKIFNLDFFDLWSDALEHYIQGDWQFAQSSFKNCYQMYHSFYQDYPCVKFLKIIQAEDGYPPDGWKKVSPLSKKWLK